MEVANQLILVGAGLIALSVIVGLVSSRFGAPLLLVFLVLGMLVGEEGPGGIKFDDFQGAYLIGSIALAIILFDGGLRTSPRDFRSYWAPASVLASIGVVITAAITGAAAKWLLGVSWLEGLLVGSIVGSTDAAAVFLLLHAQGLRLKDRARATLELEAGLNDPMAVFLTLGCVGLLTAGEIGLTPDDGWALVTFFLVQALGGIVIGVASGFGLLWLTNRLNIAPGLYPVLAVAAALLIFSGTQEVGASGFLAAYLAGYVFGSRRHRATQLINRFHDGLAWLSQITLFLMLGLLVTPSSLLPNVLPALGIAAVLIFLARPAAGLLTLPLFRFEPEETGFISWVGLRGAVPIYLGTIPVIAGVEGARVFFDVVYVVVIASLVIQGWTIAMAARRLHMVLPPRPAAPPRMDIDMPTEIGRDISVYTVQPFSLALRRTLSRMPLPPDTSIVSIFRDGEMRSPAEVERLSPGDHVLLMAPAAQLELLDRMFGRKLSSGRELDPALLGEFFFPADVAVGGIADAYEFAVPDRYRAMPVGAFLRRHLVGRPAPGRRLRLGPVELVAREVADGAVTLVAIELEPGDSPAHRLDIALIWARALLWDPVRDAPAAAWARVRARLTGRKRARAAGPQP
jgi:cell volume regulation protein A